MGDEILWKPVKVRLYQILETVDLVYFTRTGINQIKVDKQSVPLDALQFSMGEKTFLPGEVSADHPIEFPLGKIMTVLWKGENLEIGKHSIGVDFESTPFGKLSFSVKDSIRETKEDRVKVPYDREDDYSGEIIGKRQNFARSFAGADLEHVSKFSFDPAETNGNSESFCLASSTSLHSSISTAEVPSARK